jgi:hypothetical protein
LWALGVRIVGVGCVCVLWALGGCARCGRWVCALWALGVRALGEYVCGCTLLSGVC